MADIFNIVLPVFIIVGLGYLACWREIINDTHVDALMKFALNFAVPALLFRAISTLDLHQHFSVDLLITYYGPALVCFWMGFIGARLFFKRDWQDCVVIGFCAFFSNQLFIGVPITERAYGAEALNANFAIISVHSLFCYGTGISVMEMVRARQGGRTLSKALRNILKGMFSNLLVLAISLGLFVNLAGIPVPNALGDSMDLLARTALPVALFAIGGVLRRYKPEGDTKTILYVSVLSIIVQPAMTYVVAHWIGLPELYMRAAVLSAAVAPGINTYMFATLYGRAMRVAASSVLLATGLSVLSISVWLILLG